MGYFESGTYITPDRSRHNLFYRMLHYHRLYFTLKYAIIVFRTRKEAIRGNYDTKAWSDSSYYIFRFIENSGGRFHITGMENIPKEPDPVVFIGNHMSTLETMILPCLIAPHREVTFVVKESLVSHPLFGHVMRSRDPIVVGRTDPRKDLEEVMTKGPELLSRGTSIVIFPQSTRSSQFKPEEFNTLGVKLAKKMNVKVIPVALKTDFWGQGTVIKELGPLDNKKTIYFRFGEPFEVKTSGKEENQKIVEFIQSSLEEWTR